MTTTDIRTALAAVADATDAPDVDQVAFQGRVRAARRRRTTSRVVTAVAAVGVAASVAVVGVRVAGDDAATELPPVAPPGEAGAVDALPDVSWFVLDGKLAAIDRSGFTYEIDQAVEGVVGYTSETVFATTRDSRLVAYRTITADSEGGSGVINARAEVPTDEPVGSAALSGDGRYLGWIDTGDPADLTAYRYDLKAERIDLEVPVAEPVSLLDVGAEGLLIARGQDVMLADANSEITVTRGGADSAAKLAMTTVSVPGDDGRTRLYDVGTGTATLTDTIVGHGVLSPYGDHLALMLGEPGEPDTRIAIWSEGTTSPPMAPGPAVEAIRWADEQSLLVLTGSPDGDVLHGCGLDVRCVPLLGERDIDLRE